MSVAEGWYCDPRVTTHDACLHVIMSDVLICAFLFSFSLHSKAIASMRCRSPMCAPACCK